MVVFLPTYFLFFFWVKQDKQQAMEHSGVYIWLFVVTSFFLTLYYDVLEVSKVRIELKIISSKTESKYSKQGLQFGRQNSGCTRRTQSTKNESLKSTGREHCVKKARRQERWNWRIRWINESWRNCWHCRNFDGVVEVAKKNWNEKANEH